MRLIDADVLKERWTIASPEPYNTDAAEVLDNIDETPTAYDIDKVVVQFKENYSCDVGNLKMISLDKAIEIVKGR